MLLCCYAAVGLLSCAVLSVLSTASVVLLGDLLYVVRFSSKGTGLSASAAGVLCSCCCCAVWLQWSLLSWNFPSLLCSAAVVLLVYPLCVVLLSSWVAGPLFVLTVVLMVFVLGNIGTFIRFLSDSDVLDLH